MNRFDYVKYDDVSNEKQAAAKIAAQQLEQLIERIDEPATKHRALEALEVAYMWIGKGIRNDQWYRTQRRDLEERRTCDGRVSSANGCEQGPVPKRV